MTDTVQVISAKLQKLWNSLELRMLVLVSLFLQVVLIALGNRRKYTRKKKVIFTLWLSYLSADYIATTALGVLSQAQGHAKSSPDQRYAIMAFWAPFLLMHLGGPDTITAYALADNELWSRHLLGLLSQVIIAIYVYFRSLSGALVNYLWWVVFAAGLLKYLERTWVLFSASRDQFRESMVSRADPGPNYAKFMDELVSKQHEGYIVSLDQGAFDIDDDPSSPAQDHPAEDVASNSGGRKDAGVLMEAYSFFKTFKRLFADLILSFQDKKNSLSVFEKLSWERAFSMVEVELGLVYDLFYTKSFLLLSRRGLFLRFVSFSFTVAAFVLFQIIDKDVYPKTEVIITYILLVGAILLELYAFVMFLSSDWITIWLNGDWIALPELIAFIVDNIVPLLRYLYILPATTRWSNAIGQYNVLDYCLKSKPKCVKIHQFLEKKFLLWESKSVPAGLKALIFDELRERAKSTNQKSGSVLVDKSTDQKSGSISVEKSTDKESGSVLVDKSIDKESGSLSVGKSTDQKSGSVWVDKILLKEMNYLGEDDEDQEVVFDQSLLLWHLATDFCFHTDIDEGRDKTLLYKFTENGNWILKDGLKFKRDMSRLLSNYMMHLLIVSPFMLPSGIGQIRFQDTCAEVTEFFLGEPELSEKKVCEMLREVDTRYAPSEVKGDRSKSLLFDACRLAESLQSLEANKRWDIITQAWLDMLTFAAAQCSWSDHAEKLSQGGELLTHVWLLMAHFGMTNQFQISKGYIRAKLDSK